MFQYPEVMPYTVHSICTDISARCYRKMVQTIGIFKKKTFSYVNILGKHSRIFGLHKLNHCMIMHVVTGCFSFDSL